MQRAKHVAAWLMIAVLLTGLPGVAAAQTSAVGDASAPSAPIAEEAPAEDQEAPLESPAENGSLAGPEEEPDSGLASEHDPTESDDALVTEDGSSGHQAPTMPPDDTTPDEGPAPGWCDLPDGGRGYLLPDGSFASGFTRVDESVFWFDPSSRAMAHGWLDLAGARYWLDPETGVMAASAWVEDGGSRYWAGADGRVLEDAWHAEGDDWWWLGADGRMLEDAWHRSGSDWYWMGADGRMVRGWADVAGARYWFNPSTGIMASSCWHAEGSDWWWLGADGKMAADCWHRSGSAWYWMGSDGRMARGWQDVGGSRYWLDPSTGIMASSCWHAEGDDWWWLGADGRMLENAWHRSGSAWYWMGADGRMVRGWMWLGDSWYYFNYSGVMQTGWQLVGPSWYYLNPASGKMATGWARVAGLWYYLDPSSGIMQTGWLQLPEGRYYLKSTGAMQTGWAYLSNKYCYFGYNGILVEERTTPRTLLTFPAGFYCSPLLADAANTPEERIEAMISTAYTYLGTTYRACTAGAPGTSADCSGLVMQCMYAAGYDPAPISPMRHALPAYEYESRNMWKLPLRHVPLSERKRGDLIFYENGAGTIIHVAIYLGNDQVIEAWPPKTVIWPLINWAHPYVYGVARLFE